MLGHPVFLLVWFTYQPEAQKSLRLVHRDFHPTRGCTMSYLRSHIPGVDRCVYSKCDAHRYIPSPVTRLNEVAALVPPVGAWGLSGLKAYPPHEAVL